MAGSGRGCVSIAGHSDNYSGHDIRGGCGSTRTRPTKTGLMKELESNIFNLGERLSVDLIQTSQIKIAQFIRSLYSGDIMGDHYLPTPCWWKIPTML
jgi:hypothetical protein